MEALSPGLSLLPHEPGSQSGELRSAEQVCNLHCSGIQQRDFLYAKWYLSV